MAGNDDETTLDTAPRRPAGALAPGTLLNGIYRIDARLGVGGMGEVYRATNINNDEQDAVKIIGRGRADQAVIEAMFRKEARVLARIRSPAVAQLKLFARDPALDLLYFITDFVPGESLLDRLKRQPASPDELRALLRRVLTGLQAVHDAGAIHRDLSPDNIILPDGDVARATIIDFGIAKELDPTHTTMVGDSFAGKLGYIAPEQLGFSGSQVGPWTDLYSLALVGVAFAAGKPLDMGHTVGRAEEARRGPIDLSAVPADLQPLFARLLTYDWRERPASASAVLEMLADDAPPPAPARTSMPARLPEAATTGQRSSFRTIALLALLLVAIVAGGVLAVRWASRSDPMRLALPDAPVRVTPGGMKYQVVLAGDGTTRVPAGGWADIATQIVQPTGAGGDLEEQRYRVPPDHVPPGLAEALALMTKGAKWRVWSPLPSGGGKASTRDDGVAVFDVTLEGVSGEAGPVIVNEAGGPRIEVALPDAAGRPSAGTPADTLPSTPTVTPSSCGPSMVVSFGPDRSTMPPGGPPLIASARQRADICLPRQVVITGRALTSEAASFDLARRRADAIADALRRAGVAPDLLVTKVFVASPDPRDPAANAHQQAAEITFVKS